jgi:hypothetical protein
VVEILQDCTAWHKRLETEVGGITALINYDQYGTAEHGRHHNHCNFQANPVHAVMFRRRHGRDYGPVSKTVFLTNASVQQPLQPFDGDDDRSLIKTCCIKESKQPWSVKYPPQKTARAVRVHVIFTPVMFVLATASRLQREQESFGSDPVGYQRRRRQLEAQTRDKVIVFVQGDYCIFPMAEYSMLLRGRLKDVPPEIGTPPEVLVRYELTAHGGSIPCFLRYNTGRAC